VSDGPYVSVVGSATASGELYEKAREVGRLVAERGGTLICGGRSGVMEAAARGATEAGGVAIGISLLLDSHGYGKREEPGGRLFGGTRSSLSAASTGRSPR
jgi:predicted Rossmann-fold nucleotide-binding protein